MALHNILSDVAFAMCCLFTHHPSPGPSSNVRKRKKPYSWGFTGNIIVKPKLEEVKVVTIGKSVQQSRISW